METKHKYKIGTRLWIRGDFCTGQGAYIGKVIKLDTFSFPKADGTTYTGNCYVCEVDGSALYASWEEKYVQKHILAIKEGKVLADYDNEEEMKPYR